MNQFPQDFPHTLTGFGGDPNLDRARHRERLRKCPVILMHGNASHSADPKYGMATMKTFLKDAGWQDCEIWCCDYLGEDNVAAVLADVHRNHIDAVRGFIDDVRAYLGVQRVDFIAHSLGCGMVNGYLRGLQASGAWDNTAHRLDAAGAFVSIAGAHYGLGPGSIHEFRTGSEFEVLSHRFGAIAHEDTPAGAADTARQEAPNEAWTGITELDDDRLSYVAVIARGDFVDQQYTDTSRRNGADLNKVVNVGAGTGGHEKVIKNQAVFDAFKGYLNRYPPAAPITFSVDKASGNHGPSLQVTVTVAPADAAIVFAARRLTKAVEAGFLVETVAEALGGALTNGQSLVLAEDGAWDVRFSAAGGATVERTYGVNVLLPEVTILTDNAMPFDASLEVRTSTSKGTVFFSSDRQRWLAQSNPVIRETATLYFIAIDADGLASPVVSRTFEKKAVPFVKATLTEHFIAQRLDVDDYVALTLELGANAVIVLYHIDGEWVRDPEAPQVEPAQPVATAIRPALVACDIPGGVYPHDFDAQLSAPADALVHYTEDGSDPSNARNPRRQSFTGNKRFAIRGNGPHALLCHARDGAGGEALQAFGWRVDDRDYPETRIAPAAGGSFLRQVRIELDVLEPSAWTRYTLDGSEPSATNGNAYTSPIVLDRSARLRFRSMGASGKLEPVRSATFIVHQAPDRMAFDSDARRTGCVVARRRGDGGQARVLVGTGSLLRVGAVGQDAEARAIVHFDTSLLPDNGIISHACVEVTFRGTAGDPWAGGGTVSIDVQRGHFSSPRALHADDWEAAATARDAAHVASFGAGATRSSDFSPAGLAAIDKAGVTQLRLRLATPDGAPPAACLMLEGARQVKLYVTLANPA